MMQSVVIFFRLRLYWYILCLRRTLFADSILSVFSTVYVRRKSKRALDATGSPRLRTVWNYCKIGVKINYQHETEGHATS